MVSLDSGQAVVTELDDEELKNIKKVNKSISSEDVLFVYEFFKKGEKDLMKEIK